MTKNCAGFQTAPRSSGVCAVRAKRRIQQWQGFAARFYDIGTAPISNCAKALRSLQVIDSKEENELRNCAPLKGGRDSGAVPEISSPSRESGREKEPSFSGTKRYRSRVDRSAWRDSVHLPGINN
jgi:hypothetical protein